ncbi:hypothetical protein GALMADRAFT_1208633 [Galerina marginata CBS 339.88]|uniref:Uncharacterized protein n=1 Tax=Galerina marginata (strain CBS 339.88) TaxID=685588 RepID=A0A067S5H9_GALM3|nr:hypothetical protein GALMADRAFT_1208633 [Galerina marginata CBS 339.88]
MKGLLDGVGGGKLCWRWMCGLVVNWGWSTRSRAWTERRVGLGLGWNCRPAVVPGCFRVIETNFLPAVCLDDPSHYRRPWCPAYQTSRGRPLWPKHSSFRARFHCQLPAIPLNIASSRWADASSCPCPSISSAFVCRRLLLIPPSHNVPFFPHRAWESRNDPPTTFRQHIRGRPSTPVDLFEAVRSITLTPLPTGQVDILHPSEHLPPHATTYLPRSLLVSEDHVRPGAEPRIRDSDSLHTARSSPEVAIPYRARSQVSMRIVSGEESVDD